MNPLVVSALWSIGRWLVASALGWLGVSKVISAQEHDALVSWIVGLVILAGSFALTQWGARKSRRRLYRAKPPEDEPVRKPLWRKRS